jgi:tetratricopeptide (TPR) repeat protein
LLTLFATCAIPMLPAHAASYAETRESIHPGEQNIQNIELEQVIATPASFFNERISFRCLFIENGNLFDPLRSFFLPNCYFNLIVWDDRANLWDPAVRAQPLTTVFISKDRPDASIIPLLKKYQLIEVIGEVTSVLDGQPMISLHSIRPIDDEGSFSDLAIYHIELANSLSADGAYDIAEDHYVAALKEPLPVSSRILIGAMRAKNLMSGGRYDTCAATLRQLLPLAVGDKQLDRKTLAGMHFLMAKAIAETGSHSPEAVKEAVEHARTAVALDPEQGDAYAVLGITLASMAAEERDEPTRVNEYNEARKQCEKAVRLRPNNAEVRWYLGRIFDKQGSFDEAIDALRKAIDLTPKDYRIHKAIAQVYFHRGVKGGPNVNADLVTALREYDISIRLNNTDPEVHFGSGQVLETAAAAKVEVQVGTARQPATFAMAIDRYKNALTVDPKYLPARRSLVNRYRADNQPDEAIAQLKAIYDLERNEQNIIDLTSLIWQQGGKQDAYDRLQEFNKSSPTNVRILYTLGHYALDMENYPLGIQWEEKLLAIQPQHGPGNLDMALLKLGLGATKEALRYARVAESVLTEVSMKTKAQEVIRQIQATPPK